MAKPHGIRGANPVTPSSCLLDASRASVLMYEVRVAYIGLRTMTLPDTAENMSDSHTHGRVDTHFGDLQEEGSRRKR